MATPIITIPTELIMRQSVGPVRSLSPASRTAAPALTAS
jgi:LacI family transcriptional regulator